MTSYMISFRIASGADYSERWTSVVDRVRKLADGGTYWEEMTSQIFIKNSMTPEELATAIYLGSQFSTMRDKLLVVDVHTGAYATRGEIDYPATLKSLLTRNVFGAHRVA